MGLTTIDLFAGAGGLTEGFRQADALCLYANDADARAVATFRHNHPATWAECRPIEDVDPGRVRRRLRLLRGDLDVLVGGPPCQGFSINAPGRFLDDTRNALFRHYVRFLDEFEPRAFVLENVPGMLSLADGAIFEEIVGTLVARGYAVSARVLFAAHYGVPQERWRLILLGSEHGLDHPEPAHAAAGRANFRGARSMTLAAVDGLPAPVTVGEAIGDLPRLRAGEGAEEMAYGDAPASPYAAALRAGSPAIFNHVAGRLAAINQERLRHVGPGGSWRDIPFDLLPKGMQRARRSDHTKRYGRLRTDGLGATVMTKCDPHWGPVFLPDQDRALTVREAARLQSFPDRFRFLGSRVAQYEQVGNAVPPLMARAIADALAAQLGPGRAEPELRLPLWAAA